MNNGKLASVLLLAMSGIFGGADLQGQTSRGTVTGIVADSTGASVQGATVEIQNRETGVTRSTTTNVAGLYRFDAVDLGTYDLSIKRFGFKIYSSREIPVEAAQLASVNATLELGEAASTIEVSEDAVQLQTDAPVRGGNISATQSTQLPFASRNPALLAVILPGVTEQRSNLPGIATFVANGARGRSNNFLLDGTENNDISVAGQAFQIKNPETIQEVSVQTSNYDAEFGRAGGAVVNTVTKSGTNNFHGTLHWLADFTNDDAITNTLSLSSAVKERGKVAPGYEQFYGGTLGGRIKRDRTFFFTSWQEQRRNGTNSASFVVPSEQGRQQIRNAVPAGSNPRADLYLDITKAVSATGNFSNVDLGSGRGIAQFGTGVLAYPFLLDGRQSLSKVDHHFSDSDLMSLRYGYDRTLNPTAAVNFPGFFTSQEQRYQNVVLTETHIFSPTLTNEFRLPYNRIVYEFPMDPSDPRGLTMPVYSFTGLSPIGVASTFPQGRTANNFIFQDTINYIRGKHSFRFGLDLLQQRSRQSAPGFFRGNVAYGASSIAGQTYSQFANFLDDYAGTGGVTRDFGSSLYYPELFRQAYFAQDRWKIQDNLTLTLGLRWEDFGTPMNSVRTPAYAGLFNVRLDPVAGTFTAPMTEPNEVRRDLNNFSPAVGITWSPKFREGVFGRIFGERKTVFRTGYQIGYDSFFNNLASNAASSSPNLITTLNQLSVDASNPRGLAHVSTLLPTAAREVLPTDQQTLLSKDLRNPYYQRWSFGIQRELSGGFILDAAYVGSKGTGLYIEEELNPLLTNPARRVLPAGYATLDELQAATPYKLQTRLDPLQGARSIRTNNGHSSYHSGQFQLTKRFTKDFGFSAAYTWSKMLDNSSELSLYNNSTQVSAVPSPFGGLALEKGRSLFDRPYRFVLTFNYLLPFRKQQNGIIGRVLGGWQVSSITTLESGVPFNVSNGADADGLGGSDRPDLNPAGRAGVRARPDGTSSTGYVNPDVLDSSGRPVPIDPREARYIGLPANIGRTGTAGRNLERTPGIRNVDANLFKSLKLGERLNLEIRGEFYNLFNHPQYGYPSVSPFTSSITTPASNVTGSLSGQFLNYAIMDGGARVVRYNLTLRF